MLAGLLNEIIEIYIPEFTINEFGEQVEVYKKSGNTRAQVINNSGNRENTNNEIFYSYHKTFKVRRYVRINESNQIKYLNKMYRILSIEDDRKYNNKVIDVELIND